MNASFFYKCFLFPSHRLLQFSFLLTQIFNSLGIHRIFTPGEINFVNMQKLKFWGTSSGCWHWLLVYLWSSLPYVSYDLLANIVQYVRLSLEPVRRRSRSPVPSRKSKDIATQRIQTVYLSYLLAFPQDILVNIVLIRFQHCRCAISFFLVIYVNNLVEKMSF